MEEAFVVKDPFSADGGMITLGSSCCICGARVCLSQGCSLFYTKRFCLTCVKRNMKEFPMEITEKLGLTYESLTDVSKLSESCHMVFCDK
ncbi:cysteine-rich DPF motif domain-containing protein 1-like [Saccostrea cucullata]|uniref:cysteine-rich DPF motif domain-containing protein 1-like n=1 Tax=Saccostrea cuccullata TaxID=36930 RepID=UPI002ED031DC